MLPGSTSLGRYGGSFECLKPNIRSFQVSDTLCQGLYFLCFFCARRAFVLPSAGNSWGGFCFALRLETAGGVCAFIKQGALSMLLSVALWTSPAASLLSCLEGDWSCVLHTAAIRVAVIAFTISGYVNSFDFFGFFLWFNGYRRKGRKWEIFRKSRTS